MSREKKKNLIGKILSISLSLLFGIYIIGLIFIEKLYLSGIHPLVFVYFHAFISLISGLFMIVFTAFLMSIKLPKIKFSVKGSKWLFLVTILFIFLTYFVIGELLWSFLLSSLTEINIIKTSTPEVLTRIIPTIGIGIIFFYKAIQYLEGFKTYISKIKVDISKELMNIIPFIPLNIRGVNVLKEVLRDVILGTVFLAFLIISFSEKSFISQYYSGLLWSDAMISALFVSLIFTSLELFIWIVTTQYIDDLISYATELISKPPKPPKEYKIGFIEDLKKSKRIKKIYSFMYKHKNVFCLSLIIIFAFFIYFSIKSSNWSEEYVLVKAKIINVSISDENTGKIYYSEFKYPKENKLSFQLTDVSSMNNTHVLKKVDEDRANAGLLKIVKKGYINVDIRDTFSFVKIPINRNEVKNVTSYTVPEDKTSLLFSPIDGDVFLFLLKKLNITQFCEISSTDYSATGEDQYINKLNIFNENGNISSVTFYEHYHAVPFEDIGIIFMNNKTIANELKEFLIENNRNYPFEIMNKTNLDLRKMYEKCIVSAE